MVVIVAGSRRTEGDSGAGSHRRVPRVFGQRRRAEAGGQQRGGESAGAGHSHAQHHTHTLSVEGQVADGRLEMRFSFSENLFHEDSIESLALFFMESLDTLIDHCQSPEAGGYTASDFALSELDEEDLEAAFDEVDW